MKLGRKISLPIALIAATLFLSLGAIVYDLKREEAMLVAGHDRVQRLNTYSIELAAVQNKVHSGVLSYALVQDQEHIDQIVSAQTERALILDAMYPYIVDDKAKELIGAFILSRQNAELLRDELIAAVQLGDQELIRAKYEAWKVSSDLTNARLADFSIYNVGSISRSLNRLDEIKQSIKLILLIDIVLFVLLVSFLYFYTSRLILRPISELVEASKRIGSGDLDYRIAIKTGDEIGELAQAFGSMSSKLGGLYKDMEMKIKVRTQDLENTRQFLDSIIENMPSMVFVKDAKELKFIRLNRAGEELIGYAREEMLGKSDYDFFTKEQADFFTAKDREVLRSESLLDIPAEIIQTKKNGARTLHTQKIPLFDKKGKPLYLLGLSEDITEKKRSEEKMKNLNLRFLLATKSAKLGVWEWDIVTNSLVWDEQMHELYGVRATDFSKTFDAWINGLHPDDRERLRYELDLAVKGEKDFDTTFRVIWPNKEVHDIRAHGYLEKDVDGKPVRMVGINFDVTEAHAADKAKTEFVSLASHQLRTPPSIIKWNVELLREKKKGFTKGEQKILTEINDANERMIGLVRALLNVSRIEVGSIEIDPVPVQCDLVIDEIIEELKPDMQSKELVFTKEYQAGIPAIQADKHLCGIIFQNLLTNAVRYTHQGGHIAVKLLVDKDMLEFSVADNGCGIPRDQQSKIFTKLFRADNAQAIATDGTGLGLYLVKSILDTIGGKVWFESEEDRGSTFYVHLPLKGMPSKQGTTKLMRR